MGTAEQRPRVVHVDDNRADAVTVRRLIADVAPETEVLSLDSSEALFDLLGESGELERTHLVLLDLRMPRMSGHETIARLKGHPQLAHIPVVALTSSRNPADLDMAYGRGANAYLVKSANLEQYRRKLTAALLLWCSPECSGRAGAAANMPDATALAGDGELRALIVEDAAGDVTLLRRQLEDMSYWNIRCDVATSLAEAQECLEARGYDLLFLDHRLPDGSGLDLLERVHHLLGDAGTILLTGYGDERVASDAIRAGVDAYIAKRDMDPATLEGSMGRALERARHRCGLHLDPLTGLGNRSAFEERLVEECNRCQRYSGRFALMLIDLDSFKTVNDSLGHPVGDELLKQCAATFRDALRREDFLARYGGDEFCIIAHESSVQQAERLAHRLRAHLCETVFHCGREQHAVQISCSIGIVGVSDATGGDTEEALRQVDAAMYAAKEAGDSGVRVVDRTDAVEDGR